MVLGKTRLSIRNSFDHPTPRLFISRNRTQKRNCERDMNTQVFLVLDELESFINAHKFSTFETESKYAIDSGKLQEKIKEIRNHINLKHDEKYNAVVCSICNTDTQHIHVGYNEIGMAILECTRCRHRWYYNDKLDSLHLKVDGH